MKGLILFVLLAWQMTATTFGYVQSASQSGNAPLAFPGNNTAGNAIVVYVSNNGVSAVNDTTGNSYIQVSTQAVNGAALEVWIATNILPGTNSVTATGLTGSGAYSSIVIIEYQTPPISTYTFAVTTAGYGALPSGSTPQNGCNCIFSSPSETMLSIASYDFHSSHAWTGTNLTVRQTTSEAGGQTLGAGDFDAASRATSVISTLNGTSSAFATVTASVLFTSITSGSGAAPSASAFVGI